MARLRIANVLACTTLVWSGCGANAPEPSATAAHPAQVTSAASQAAAMELGFTAGGMLALVAVPASQRQGSFAGFVREEQELQAFAKELPLADGGAAALTALHQGHANPDSMAGAQTILQGTNAIKDALAASDHPDLMPVFRIGFAVGFVGETFVFLAGANPTDEFLAKYMPMVRRYRSTLPDDLTRAGLSQEMIDAVGGVDRDVTTASHLKEVVNACLTVKDLASRLGGVRAPAAAGVAGGAAEVWQTHTHPIGFSFKFPTGWTVEDDAVNKTTLLLPPGITLNSPGPHAIFTVSATPLQADPLAMRAYFERQFAPARVINFTKEPLKSSVGTGAILSWQLQMPPTNSEAGFRTFVMIMKRNWAVHIDAFGPASATTPHDGTMREIIDSLTWK